MHMRARPRRVLVRYSIVSLMEKRVDVLSSFISEQEEWLDDWLAALGWRKESLRAQTMPELIQCPHNPHHYLPKSSMEKHMKKCGYAEALDTNIWSLEEDKLIPLETDSSFLYKDSSTVESVRIDKSVVRAVKKLAQDQPEMGQITRSHDHHKMDEHFSSLESSKISPQEILNQPYTQLISYIKSWKTVPCDFSLVDGSTLNLSKVKGWLFKNLPEKHAHSSVLGGEISMVDSIMSCLMIPPHLQKAKKPNLTPNLLLNRLRPLLGLNTRGLVLSLWKFLHISKVQEKHNVEDSLVDEIIPMALEAVDGMRREEANEESDVSSVAELIYNIIKQGGFSVSGEASLPLPPDYVAHQLSTLERRILYDYVIEVTSRQAFMKLDADLYRDDMATIRAQMKAQGKLEAAAKKEEKEEEVDTRGKTYLQLLKEKRDYKRRRQKYRAKNVHITRKTPTEIFRTIIRNRMEEMRAMLTDKDLDAHSTEADAGERTVNPENVETSRRRVRSKSRERGLERDRHHKRHRSRDGDEGGQRHRKKYRSRSRERGRSKSRERRRSKSRERRRSKSRKRGRSKSRERRNKKHKKHRHRSRSNS